MQRFALPLLVVTATLVLLGLGTWQVQRLAWKEGLIAAREEGLSKPPAPLPTSFAGAGDAQAFDFRKVTVTGVFRHDLEQLFGAKARGGVLGHHVLTPLVRADGPAILVDRGWVPADKAHPASRPKGQPDGEVTVAGIARYRAADRPGPFTPDNDPEAGVVSLRSRRWRRRSGFTLSPIVVEADDAPNPGGLPIGGRTVIRLTNNHLQYAVTWYGLAAALIGVYIVFRRARPGATT